MTSERFTPEQYLGGIQEAVSQIVSTSMFTPESASLLGGQLVYCRLNYLRSAGGSVHNAGLIARNSAVIDALAEGNREPLKKYFEGEALSVVHDSLKFGGRPEIRAKLEEMARLIPNMGDRLQVQHFTRLLK